MQGRSQGNSYPEYGSTHSAGLPRERDLTCGNTRSSWACRKRGNRQIHIRHARPRVLASDAALVRQRVEAHAAPLRLRGARQRVLAAVLGLLCGWSRVTDDAVRLRQIAEAIVADHSRLYDLKTVGRALASLADDQLITYRPARGRGQHAEIAIHPQFLADVRILARDADGRVITHSVTFSDSPPLISQEPHPPTPRHHRAVPDPRPTAVNVNPAEVRTVLRELPAVYQGLPAGLRWRLGGEIRNQLAAGWLPEQILAVLSAPMPADVHRPWRLALYRLRRNIIGAGPRLRPLQQAWDERHAAAERQAAQETTNRWLTAVTAATDERLRDQILQATDQLKPASWRPVVNPKAALAHAGRMALREFPTEPLGSALRRWTANILGNTQSAATPSPPTDANLTSLIAPACGDSHTCVSCQNAPGSIRPQLPLPTPICDDCWIQNADPELLEDIPA